MRLVFNLDGVICTPAKGIRFGIIDYIKHSKPLANAVEFMQWIKGNNHEITIWCNRPNDLAVKFATEQWLDLHQVPYDRLIFDSPVNPIFVDETPANCRYFRHIRWINYIQRISSFTYIFSRIILIKLAHFGFLFYL